MMVVNPHVLMILQEIDQLFQQEPVVDAEDDKEQPATESTPLVA